MKPQTSWYPSLKKLVLENCINLPDHQLEFIKKLKFFSLKGYKNLKTLSRKFEIESLEIFIFSICLKVRRIPKFGENKEGVSKLLLDDVVGSRTKEELVKEWSCQFEELNKPRGFRKTQEWE